MYARPLYCVFKEIHYKMNGGTIIMKTYSVHFIDCKDGLPNHKLLEANSMNDVQQYMEELGHAVVSITEKE